MKVCGDMHRGVSTTYAIMVGKVEANAWVMMDPDADHVKISIWPGVSAMMYCSGGSRFFSQSCITCPSQTISVLPETPRLKISIIETGDSAAQHIISSM